MGFLEKILSGALVKALDKIVDRVISFFNDWVRRDKLVKRAKDHIEETDKKVTELETLQAEAKALYEKAELEKFETGEISQETKDAIEAIREKIRAAGRRLIRG